ncbi:DUF2147 domain-containing protein [Devosia sp.]|uniref:DUF2147 domain-containing protein n=1 Tax=Devosia sp. TaxID=1871048 RepID=UPI003A90BF20
MSIASAFAQTFAGRIALTALAATMAVAPVAAASANPTGTWQTTSGDSRYTVSYCGDGTQLCAKLIWLRADARTAENLAYLNEYVVIGADAAAANKWKGEVNYAGDTFSGSLTLTGADSMKLSGCKGIFCTTMKFSRV